MQNQIKSLSQEIGELKAEKNSEKGQNVSQTEWNQRKEIFKEQTGLEVMSITAQKSHDERQRGQA